MNGRYSHLRRWQIALRESGLSKAAKALGAFLSFRMNERGTIAGGQFPSIETLAKDASWSPRSADGALKELRQAGLIEVSSGKGRHVVNRYTLTIPDHLEVRVEYVLTGGKTVPEKAQTTTGKGAKDDVENAQGLRTSIAVSNAVAATAAAACVRCGSLLGSEKTHTWDGPVCLPCDSRSKAKARRRGGAE